MANKKTKKTFKFVVDSHGLIIKVISGFFRHHYYKYKQPVVCDVSYILVVGGDYYFEFVVVYV